MTAQPTQLLGQLLNQRYRIIEPLGSGGFSRTYLAEDTQKTDTPKCVIKHLRPASNDPTFLQTARRLFKSEAEALKALGHHDQIPELFEAFEENQEFYLAQEFIDGYPLNLEMAPGQRWSEAQVLQLLQEVLSILTFVHSYGVIHRDLKPDNLIRRQHDHKLVLIDFGSVKQIQTQLVTPQGHLSATVAVGTPGYLSSEQGQGKPRPSSDIYSLGLIGVQALTGLHPTQLPDDPQTGEKSWRHYVPVSDGLAYVLDKMVRYHHKDRYASTEEAQQALQQVIDGSIVLPTASSESSNPVTPAPAPNPEPTPVLAASANPTTPAPRPSAKPPQWQQFLPYANMITVAIVIAAVIAFNLNSGKQGNSKPSSNHQSSNGSAATAKQATSAQPAPSETSTKPKRSQSTSSASEKSASVPSEQPVSPTDNPPTEAQSPTPPRPNPDVTRLVSPPVRPVVKPTPTPTLVPSLVNQGSISATRSTTPPPNLSVPTTSSKAITQMSPVNFVYDVARAGRLKQQKIPGGALLTTEYQVGKITAEDVVKAGVAAEVLPPGTELDKEYIDTVDRQLDMLR